MQREAPADTVSFLWMICLATGGEQGAVTTSPALRTPVTAGCCNALLICSTALPR